MEEQIRTRTEAQTQVWESTKIEKLECTRRGHPLLLGPKIDGEVQEYVKSLREAGAVVNSAIVRGVAEGIVKKYGSNLLSCSGGHINLTKTWTLSFLDRIGFVKRRASTKAKITPADFETHKQFLFDEKTIAEMEEIPRALIINWDHTGNITSQLAHARWQRRNQNELKLLVLKTKGRYEQFLSIRQLEIFSHHS